MSEMAGIEWIQEPLFSWGPDKDNLPSLPEQQFMKRLAKAQNDCECWIWIGTTRKGDNGNGYIYPYFYLGSDNGQKVYVAAHRWSYEHFIGPIPDEYVIDHVWSRGCVTTLCVNPVHLEAVTQQENILRGNSYVALAIRNDECKNGHSLADASNVHHDKHGYRVCRACNRNKTAKYRTKLKGET